MSNTITLLCVVRDESADHAFAIEIEKTLFISHLKKAIKAEKPNGLSNVDADELMLWRVNVSDEEYNALNGNLPDESEKLYPTRRIGKYFTDEPKDERIHIIIETPSTPSGNFSINHLSFFYQ